MAVHIPAPPAAPTPPVMPRVELTEGGTVHIVKGKPPSMSDEQRARDYVATGNGALSKTTVSGDKDAKTADNGDAVTQSDGNAAATTGTTEHLPAKKTIPTGRREQKTSPTKETGGRDAQQTDGTAKINDGFLADTADNETASAPIASNKTSPQTSTKAASPLKDYTPPNGGHGALYWGFSLAVAVILAVVVFKTFGQKIFVGGAVKTNSPAKAPDGNNGDGVPPRFEARV